MTRKIHTQAGKPASAALLIDVPKLIAAYYDQIPDFNCPRERVIFGTSGHRGSSLNKTFNEWHILAITQAICLYRKYKKIKAPLYLGMDTHALSQPAFETAISVLAANHITVLLAENHEYTPTPALSLAILTHNKNRRTQLADGIIITPSHNPPADGGFKYNSSDGGPADITVTRRIENKANEFLENKLKEVKRLTVTAALKASTTHYFNYLELYVNELQSVINMQAISDAQIHIGVDPLGGAGVHYWEPIAKRYHLNLTVMNKKIDPTFSFMPVDWDNQIRMNPESIYAMANVIKQKNNFDISFACDTDHDRHGIVSSQYGLIPTNHYLAVAIAYLFKHRPQWSRSKMVSKSIVVSSMINWVCEYMGISVYEVPVGFKWFVKGLINGKFGFCGEQSAGGVFNRINGKVWTTDKDGMLLGLLSAEITAVIKKDIGVLYQDLENQFGKTFYKRVDTHMTDEQKSILFNLSPDQIKETTLADDSIESILRRAPGNNADIGGIKVITKNGWFVARPSGTEEIYEIFAESFVSEEHLNKILKEAQGIINDALHREANKSTEPG